MNDASSEEEQGEQDSLHTKSSLHNKCVFGDNENDVKS